MTHLQDPPPGWLFGLDEMPDGVILKAFSASVLKDGLQHWTAQGRNPRALFTDFRFYNYIYPFDRPYSWEEHKAIWRANFGRWDSPAMRESEMPFVRMVELLNEHTDTRHASDKELLAPHLLTLQAAVSVWETEFRGKGGIPDDCRVGIGNVPVGNDIPLEFFDLAISTNNVLCYHDYSSWWAGKRDPVDWEFLSGRWWINELFYNRHPLWALTEGGPFGLDAEGWRTPGMMLDQAGMAEANAQVALDIMQTAAYQQGRVLGGPAALFTSFNGPEWGTYKHHADDIAAVGRAWKATGWRLMPLHQEVPVITLTDAQVADLNGHLDQINTHSQAIRELVKPPAPAALFRVKIIVPVLNVRAGPAATAADVGDVLKDAVVPVFEVFPNGWYRIDQAEQKWISGGAQYSVKV